MPDFRYEPSLAKPLLSPETGRFFQTVTLRPRGRAIGWSRWTISDEAGGIMQWLDVAVIAEERRRGHAKALFRASVDQARQHLAAHGRPLRRAWAAVSQVPHVQARALLTGLGFHHMANVPSILVEQDFLVYVKAFD